MSGEKAAKIKAITLWCFIPVTIVLYSYSTYMLSCRNEKKNFEDEIWNLFEKIDHSLVKSKELVSYLSEEILKSQDPLKTKTQINKTVYSSNKTLGIPPIRDIRYLEREKAPEFIGDKKGKSKIHVIDGQIYLWNYLENIREYIILKLTLDDILTFFDQEKYKGLIHINQFVNGEEPKENDRAQKEIIYRRDTSKGVLLFSEIPQKETYLNYLRTERATHLIYILSIFLILFFSYALHRLRTKNLKLQADSAVSEVLISKTAQEEIQKEVDEKNTLYESIKNAQFFRNKFYKEINERRGKMLDEIIAASHIMIEGLMSERLDKEKGLQIIHNILETASNLQGSVYKKDKRMDVFDLENVVSECLGMHSDLIKHKQLSIKYEPMEILIKKDIFLLKVVIANIIEKALISSEKSTDLLLRMSKNDQTGWIQIFFKEAHYPKDYVLRKNPDPSALKMIRLEDDQIEKNASSAGISYQKSLHKENQTSYKLQIPLGGEAEYEKNLSPVESNVVRVSFR